MSNGDISIASISNKKLESASQEAQVAVFKKALDQSADISKQLIQSATSTPLPPGVGSKVNTVA